MGSDRSGRETLGLRQVMVIFFIKSVKMEKWGGFSV